MIQKNKLTHYLFSSWDFNCSTREQTIRDKTEICSRIKTFADNINNTIINTNEKNKKLYFILSIILYIFFVLFCILIELGSFYLRDEIRDKKDTSGKYVLRDVIGDILPIILIAIWFLLFPYLTTLLTCLEKKLPNFHISLSSSIKQLILMSALIGILCFVQVYFVIQDKFIINSNLKQLSSFGCPGSYTNETDFTLVENAIPIKSKSYSRAREDEVGLNFLFITVLYNIFFYIREFFKCLFQKNTAFNPFQVLIIIYTKVILIILTMNFIPFCIIFLPLVLFIDFKYQVFQLKSKSQYNYNELVANKPNKSTELLIFFLCLSVVTIVVILYFYLEKFSHYG